MREGGQNAADGSYNYWATTNSNVVLVYSPLRSTILDVDSAGPRRAASSASIPGIRLSSGMGME